MAVFVFSHLKNLVFSETGQMKWFVVSIVCHAMRSHVYTVLFWISEISKLLPIMLSVDTSSLQQRAVNWILVGL